MYNRFRSCCSQCQNCDNNQGIETACDNVMSTSYNSTLYNDDCECGFDKGVNVFPNNPMLAQSYVPIQYMDKTFTPCCGLKMGTIFPELVSPYSPGQSMAEIDYLRARNEIGKGCNG